MSGDTIKERLTRIETLMENHLQHHENKDKWMLRIFGTLVTSMVLMVLPGFIKWVVGVL
jgi:hypothetical protein